MKTTLLILVMIGAGWRSGAAGDTSKPTDSITVGQAVEMTLQNHEAIREAQYRITASEARIDVSRSARYPDVSIDGRYTRLGPVSTFDLPGEGELAVAPYNNYDLHVDLRQTLYDFGKTEKSIQLAETSRQADVDNLDLVKFNLAYQTIGVFNNILILRQQIDVLDDQLQTLQQHLGISVKRMKAGTATDFDTLTIQVRIAVVQGDRIDADHALKSQEIMFRRLTGLPEETPVNLSGAFVSDSVELQQDSLVTVAVKQRPEMKLAHDAESSATARLQLVSLGDKPKVTLNFATGLKNGYEPNLDTWRGNYMAGLEMKMPVFNGRKTKHEEAAADAEISSAHSHTIDLERQIRADVLKAIAGVTSNEDKIASAETQVEQAQKAVSMARVRYAAGVVTNLDLLDAETTLSQTRLIRLRALYNYTVSLNELDRATGKVVW